jgi:hypothetical protein
MVRSLLSPSWASFILLGALASQTLAAPPPKPWSDAPEGGPGKGPGNGPGKPGKPSGPGNGPKGPRPPRGEDSYDYVIVGGGLTGLVAATRLSEDPKTNVLVVEYGRFARENSTLVPALGTALNMENLFPLFSEPEPFLADAPQLLAIGNVVGGGSTVNGMTFGLASAGDYDSWSYLGNPGWSFRELEPYFMKATEYIAPPQEIVEKYNYTIDAGEYGSDGPLKITLPHWQVPDTYKSEPQIPDAPSAHATNSSQ